MPEKNPNKFLSYLNEIGLIDNVSSQNLDNIQYNFLKNIKEKISQI